MRHWLLRPHGNCPYCSLVAEDVNHVLKCTHEQAQNLNKEALCKLFEKLMKIGTCAKTVLAIKQELIAWRDGKRMHDTGMLPILLRKVIKEQRKVGWRAFIDGLFVREWKEYQREYFEYIGSQKGAALYVIKAIHVCWDYNMYLWSARKLHKTERLQELEDKKEMIEAVKKEYKIGLGRLPVYGFSEIF